MKKLSLQLRLTILSALLLTICCIVLDFFIMNSAIMNLDSLEDAQLSVIIDTQDNQYSINVPSMSPQFMDALDQTKNNFRIQCIAVTILVILIGTSLTWFLTGIALKPLRRLNRTIQEISANNLSDTVPETGGTDEIATLTHSFNTMLQRIENSFTSQKQFSANAAHELRTPLAVLQTNLEVFEKKKEHTTEEYHQVIDTTLRQTGHMNHLISSLLELMSLHTARLTDTIDLASLAEEILVDLALPAEQKNISLTQTGSSYRIQGNEILFYRALYNLVENAIKYNHENGSVNMDIAVLSDMVQITVADTGNGIPKEHWDKIFTPFYRVDKSRSREMGGVGLGLALVNDIVELHGGRVYVKDSGESGSEMCMEFPIVK